MQLATVASAHARLNEFDQPWRFSTLPLRQRSEPARGAQTRALHRLRGEILIATKRTKEGTQELLRSLEIAKAQQAKSEEQRTAQTIAKLAGKPASPRDRDTQADRSIALAVWHLGRPREARQVSATTTRILRLTGLENSP